MKISFYFLFWFSIFGTNGIILAQPVNSTDVRIWFNNNDQMRGSIKLDGSPDYITIYKTDSDSLRIPINMVKKIKIIRDYGNTWNGKPQFTYFNNTFIGILTGRSNSTSAYRSTISAEMINGIQVYGFLWPGLGIAFDHYPEVNTLPIYFSIRGDLRKSLFTPFYYFDIGSGPAWSTDEMNVSEIDTNAGIMYHLGGGLKIYSDSQVHVMFSMGFKNQQVRFTRQLWDQSEEITDRNFKNFSFRIGIGF